jgi:hypothetical protein
MGEMNSVRAGERNETKHGKMQMNVTLKGSGIRFIKLAPSK